MPCKNHLLVTEIVKEAGNFSMKIWNWESELGVGWEICYKMYINLQNGL